MYRHLNGTLPSACQQRAGYEVYIFRPLETDVEVRRQTIVFTALTSCYAAGCTQITAPVCKALGVGCMGVPLKSLLRARLSRPSQSHQRLAPEVLRC